MNRMIEKAELMKFLYLISSKLKLNSNHSYLYLINYIELKSAIQNSCININPVSGTRPKRILSVAHEPSTIDNKDNRNETLYNKFKAYDETKQKRVFKTKLLNNNDNMKCDICGQRLKIGTFSLYSSYYNISGHYDHIINYIQARKGKNN
jgi:hypothetical protein